MSLLGSFPTELIHQIFGELERTTDVKSLRLSCQRFSEFGAKELFSTVHVMLLNESFDKLSSISQHPVHREHVKELICWLPFLDGMFAEDIHAFKQSLRLVEIQNLRAGIHKVKHTEDQIAEGFLIFSSLLHEQEALRLRYGVLIEQAISLFPRFEKLVVSRLAEWPDWLHYERHSTATNCAKYSPPTPALKIFDALYAKVLIELGCRFLDGEISGEFFLGLLKAVSNAGVTLKYLVAGESASQRFLGDWGVGATILKKLRNDRQRIQALRPTLHTNYLRNALHGLIHLDLTIVKSCTHFSPDVTMGNCYELLKLAPSLQRLKLSLGGPRYPYKVGPILGCITWPALKSLELVSTKVRSDEMIAFITRHERTLHHISFYGLCLAGVDLTEWETLINCLKRLPLVEPARVEMPCFHFE